MRQYDPLRDQRVDIAINTRQGGGQSPPLLPYDPSSPPDISTTPNVIAPNYIDGSDFDFSRNGYLLTGAGDDDYEVYNWFRQRFIKVIDLTTTATSQTVNSASNPFSASYMYPMDFVLLNGLSTGAALSGYLGRDGADGQAKLWSDVGMTIPLNVENTLTEAVMWFGDSLAESDATALKSSGHSLYAANEGVNDRIPRWDRTNGWAEFGSNTSETWDIAAPLAINLIRAGLPCYIRCIVALRSGATLTSPVRMGFGIWDSTSTQKRFLESGNFDLSVSPVGTTGTTTYNYRIIADLDDGTEIASDLVTITNGNASLSTANYNRLTWANATGVLNFRIYRQVGGVVKRIFTIRNGGHDYNDYGTDEGETPGSMPTAGVLRPIAYKVSPSFTLTSSTTWIAVKVRFNIVDTHDSSATTGAQWLRITVEGATTDVRAIVVDRVSLSTSDGGWQRSARDLSKILGQSPTSLPSGGSTQGGTGIDNCFVLDTPLIVCEKDGSDLRQIPIGDAMLKMFVVSGGTRIDQIEDIQDGVSDKIIKCTLSNGVWWKCSPSERFITSRADRDGTRMDDLILGDTILCWMNGKLETPVIEDLTITDEQILVRTLMLKSGKKFVVGHHDKPLCGAIAHNTKTQIEILNYA